MNQTDPFHFLFFFNFSSFLFFFSITWDGRFNKKENKLKLYPVKNEENQTWDGVENRL